MAATVLWSVKHGGNAAEEPDEVLTMLQEHGARPVILECLYARFFQKLSDHRVSRALPVLYAAANPVELPRLPRGFLLPDQQHSRSLWVEHKPADVDPFDGSPNVFRRERDTVHIQHYPTAVFHDSVLIVRVFQAPAYFSKRQGAYFHLCKGMGLA